MANPYFMTNGNITRGSMGSGVAVSVGVGVLVSVGASVGVAVGVGVSVGLGIGVCVSVGVDVTTGSTPNVAEITSSESMTNSSGEAVLLTVPPHSKKANPGVGTPVTVMSVPTLYFAPLAQLGIGDTSIAPRVLVITSMTKQSANWRVS